MKAALPVIVMLAACGSSPKPAPAPPAKPTVAPAPVAEQPAPESPVRKELTDLADQNAALGLAISELEANVQRLDDSEDAIDVRRTELAKLSTQRDALISKVTATGTRARAIADAREEAAELIKAAEEERERAMRSLRELGDLKAKLDGIEQSLVAKPTPVEESKPPAKKKGSKAK